MTDSATAQADLTDVGSAPVSSDTHADAGDASRAPAAARKRRHDVARDLLNWRPDDNVTMLIRDVELYHPFVCRNYNRIGIRAQLTLFMLQRVLPSNAQMVEKSEAFTKEFDRRIGEFEQQIEVDSQNLMATARENGIRSISTKMSTKPVSVQVPIYTPGMGAILGLFTKIDTLLSNVDYLYLNAVIPTGAQQSYIDKYRKLLWAEVQFLSAAWLHARRALRAVQGADKDGDATAQADAEQADAEAELATA